MNRVAYKLSIKVETEIMSGVPVFNGTRVPVSALLDNLEAGVSLDEFPDGLPEQAVLVLHHFRTSLNDLSLTE